MEDSFSDAQMIEAIVSSSNLGRPKLHHAERFKVALRMLAEKTYDLSLLDLHLPDGEGLDLITQLKQQVLEIPVVVLTGFRGEATAVAALQKGTQS
ncbi:MAG: response regulator [Phormidesmis sp.]